MTESDYPVIMKQSASAAPSTTLFGGQVVVLETEDDHFLGMVDVDSDGWFRVRSGFRGHPHLVDPDDVVSVSLATQHPLAEYEPLTRDRW